MRVVFDANVIVSAVISRRGTPGKLLKHWEEGVFDLIISPAILEEIGRVMHYPKLQQRYNLTDDFIDSFLGSLRELAVKIPATIAISSVLSKVKLLT
jgi:putative PIN family toxin of toxin-antitoxin system